MNKYTVYIGQWAYRRYLAKKEAERVRKSLEPLVLNVEVREAG